MVQVGHEASAVNGKARLVGLAECPVNLARCMQHGVELDSTQPCNTYCQVKHVGVAVKNGMLEQDVVQCRESLLHRISQLHRQRHSGNLQMVSGTKQGRQCQWPGEQWLLARGAADITGALRTVGDAACVVAIASQGSMQHASNAAHMFEAGTLLFAQAATHHTV